MAASSNPCQSQESQSRPSNSVGYREFCNWASSASDFFVARRFDALAAGVIYLMQWDITKLENGIAEWDQYLRNGIRENFHHGTFEDDHNDRLGWLRDTRQGLEEYYTFIAKYSDMRSRTIANLSTKESIRAWLREQHEPLDEKEVAFLETDDLFFVSAYHRTPLRKALEATGLFSRCRFFHRTDIRPGTHVGDEAIFYDDEKIELFVNSCICIAGFAMIAVPLWILFVLSDRRGAQLGVITAFVFARLVSIQAVSTTTKPFEAIAATAAYAAVLMVFIQQ